jgi:hypothetical protein
MMLIFSAWFLVMGIILLNIDHKKHTYSFSKKTIKIFGVLVTFLAFVAFYMYLAKLD